MVRIVYLPFCQWRSLISSVWCKNCRAACDHSGLSRDDNSVPRLVPNPGVVVEVPATPNWRNFAADCKCICCTPQDTRSHECWRLLKKDTFQWTHDVMITSLLRQNDVATSFWRNNDVIITSCVRWDDSVVLHPGPTTLTTHVTPGAPFTNTD